MTPTRTTPQKGLDSPSSTDFALPARTLGEWVSQAAEGMRRAGLRFENGMQTQQAEAEYLICHVMGLPFEEATRFYKQPIPQEKRPLLQEALFLRVVQRLPVFYITREAYFGGYRFYVDERVLLPRSRIENIFDDEEGFAGLMEVKRVRRILDLCTGSGCLATLLAITFPKARVDAADLSEEALAVARINVRQHGLEQRIRLIHSNLWQKLHNERYDLIITNPPYVPQTSFQALPPEYRHEPALALEAGHDGLDLIRPLLRQAPRHMTANALLVCETGDEVEAIIKTRWPDFPGEWLMFHFELSGVFVLGRADLEEWLNHQPNHTPP